MGEYVLEMLNVSKAFPGVQALDGVTLRVRPGSVHALMGENGAGKSTLMKCLIGINVWTKVRLSSAVRRSTFRTLLQRELWCFDDSQELNPSRCEVSVTYGLAANLERQVCSTKNVKFGPTHKWVWMTTEVGR